MKTAYLVTWFKETTNEKGCEWQNKNEKTISNSFKTENEAMNNKPKGYNNFLKI